MKDPGNEVADSPVSTQKISTRPHAKDSDKVLLQN